MRIGFLSDIHANLEACEVALPVLRQEDVDRIYCLGDLVGYGADPGRCVDLVLGECNGAVAGNHDWASVGKTDILYFNLFGRKAILWTAKVLAPHHKSQLSSLPLFISDSEWCAVHSTPEEPSQWNYIFTPAQALRQFQHFAERICFVGHSHSPAIFDDTGGMKSIVVPRDESSVVVRLRPDRRYIVNVGSVGQPRDGDPRGAVAVFDTGQNTVKFIRFEYPIAEAQRKIIEAGLPEFLADRLERGV
ncbi:metallophosphoesterase family protein [bacterium]|nr:metallophosphoesterase family protein [bacterium]